LQVIPVSGTSWKAVDELNEQLLQLAAKGAWEGVRRLERRRHQLLQNLLRESPHDPQAVKQVQNVITVDRKIVRLTLRDSRARSGRSQFRRNMSSNTTLLPK